MEPSDFKQLNLDSDIEINLKSLGFSKMTEIQSLSLPAILAGKDVIGQAQTGSGKTVAFGLGVLNKVQIAHFRIQALILCPTRELATQVAAEVRSLGRMRPNLKVLTLCGGTPMARQMTSLEHGAHIIVGTPGRILDHLSRESLDLREVKTVVLDEADRMLDMGFFDDINTILRQTSKSRQTLLFSATYPENIRSLSQKIQKVATHVQASQPIQNENIEQLFFTTNTADHLQSLLAIIDQFKPESSLIFCTTKTQCDEVAKFLCKQGLQAVAIHSDYDQRDRDEALLRFKNNSVSFLVATDVAARGINIKDLDTVINFEISKDPERHVHRIGRTGRAGRRGLAVNLVKPNDLYHVRKIEELMNMKFDIQSLACKPDKIRNKIDLSPGMQTLKIFGGKKNKLRPGDILGALIKQAGIDGKHIGKIAINEYDSYVAIDSRYAALALKRLSNSKIKNRSFGMELMS